MRWLFGVGAASAAVILIVLAAFWWAREELQDTAQQAGEEFAREELAQALRTCIEAFGNGDRESLAETLASSCSEADVAQLQDMSDGVARFLRRLWPAQPPLVRVAVDPRKLAVVGMGGGGNLRVPVDQPPGAVMVTVAGEPYPDADSPLLIDWPLVFVAEEGGWRVATCLPATSVTPDISLSAL